MQLATNPLTDRERRIIELNDEHAGGRCPVEDCDRTVDVVDVRPNGSVVFAHDGVRVRSDDAHCVTGNTCG